MFKLLSRLLKILEIVQTLGVHHIVKIGGKIIPISDSEINGIRSLIEGGLNLEPANFITVGDEVEISGGPLNGLRGYIIHSRGINKFILKESPYKAPSIIPITYNKGE